MKRKPLRARDFIADLAAHGRHHFTAGELRAALGVSPAATRLAIRRLAAKGLIASPARGFYIVLPPEYRGLGCSPAEHFIPALMELRREPYYAALLSAAEYHGAAHHRPQVFQVALRRNRPPISCGAVGVGFLARRRLGEVPVSTFRTPRGTILVSTPEATAVDLVGYPRRAGGLQHVATVLAELAERIDPQLLVPAARTAPVSWAQRLGYLLHRVGASDRTSPLEEYVRRHARRSVALAPAVRLGHAPHVADWRLAANVGIEPET